MLARAAATRTAPSRGPAANATVRSGWRRNSPQRVGRSSRCFVQSPVRPRRWLDAFRSQRVDLQLSKQVAVVAGAARGIGRAIAEAFADEGAHVVLLDRDAEVSHAAQEIGPSRAT